MFAKKLLSLVALLFVGSQISTVSAECTPSFSASCSIEGSCTSGDYGYYFVSGTTLVKVTGATTCNEVETPGYYQTKEGAYYSVSSGKAYSAVGDLSGVSTCTAGTLMKGGKLCVDADTDHAITMNNEGNFYLAVDTAAGLLTGANDKPIVVKSEEDGFSVVELTDSTSYLVKDTKTSDTIAVDSNAAKDTSIDGKEYCVDTETKIIMEKKKEFCNGNAEDNCGSYYTCSDGASCVETTTDIKDRSNCDVSSKTFACDTGYYTISQKLYYCTKDSTCTEKSTIIGYVIDAKNENSYIKCSATENTINVSGIDYVKNSCEVIAEANLKGDCADAAAGLGALIKDEEGVKFCNEASSGSPVSTSAKYLISAKETSTFIKTASEVDGSVVMVDVASNEVKLNIVAGNYLYGTNALQTNDEGEGDLYACTMTDGVSLCVKDQSTIGYLTNADTTMPYIKCELDVGDINKCSVYAAATLGSELGSSCTNVGDVIISDGLKICSGSTPAATALSDGTHYFVDASNDGSIFVKTAADNGYYIIVDVNEKDITLHRETSPKKYRYAIGTQVYFKGESTGNTCQDGTTKSEVREYLVTKEDGDIAGHYKIVPGQE